jgi:hypothetical protein
MVVGLREWSREDISLPLLNSVTDFPGIEDGNRRARIRVCALTWYACFRMSL